MDRRKVNKYRTQLGSWIHLWQSFKILPKQSFLDRDIPTFHSSIMRIWSDRPSGFSVADDLTHFCSHKFRKLNGYVRSLTKHKSIDLLTETKISSDSSLGRQQPIELLLDMSSLSCSASTFVGFLSCHGNSSVMLDHVMFQLTNINGSQNVWNYHIIAPLSLVKHHCNWLTYFKP